MIIVVIHKPCWISGELKIEFDFNSFSSDWLDRTLIWHGNVVLFPIFFTKIFSKPWWISYSRLILTSSVRLTLCQTIFDVCKIVAINLRRKIWHVTKMNRRTRNVWIRSILHTICPDRNNIMLFYSFVVQVWKIVFFSFLSLSSAASECKEKKVSVRAQSHSSFSFRTRLRHMTASFYCVAIISRL